MKPLQGIVSIFSVFRSPALWLMAAAFVVYNVNLRSETSMDTYPTRYLPLSVLRQGDLNLDEFPKLHEYPDWLIEADPAKAGKTPYFLQRTRGHYLSSYPAMPAILSAPIYAAPVALLTALHKPVDDMRVATGLSKLASSLAVAASVGIMYLTLGYLTTRRRALIIAAIYAFATSSWTLSSQGLWQTAWSQPMLAVALYFLLRARATAMGQGDKATRRQGEAEPGERNRPLAPSPPRLVSPWPLLWAGLALALCVACRFPDAIFAGLFAIYVLHQYRWRSWFFFIFPVLIGGWLLAYNYYYFGSFSGGYSGTLEETVQGAVGWTFSYPRWTAFWGLLISPSRGILILSPVLIFAFAGLLIALWRRNDRLLVYIAVASLASIVLYSTFAVWWASYCYSYRYLVDLLPGLCLFFPIVWDRIARSFVLSGLFALAIAFSLFVQIVGAFYFPSGDWYHFDSTGRRITITEDPRRLWDWTDCELVRCLKAGPARSPLLRKRQGE